MQEAVLKFYKYLKDTRQMSENTCLAYKRDLKHFAEYLSWNYINEPRDVTKENIENYLDYLTKNGKSPATTARVVCSIRSFYDYLGISNPASSVDIPKVIKKEKRVVTREEAEYRIANIEGDRDKAVRDRAMLSLMYDAGLKASQVTSLRMEDVDLVSCLIKVSKAGRQNYLDFNKETKDALTDYLDNVRPGMAASVYIKELFVNCDGRPLSRQGLWKIIKKYR